MRLFAIVLMTLAGVFGVSSRLHADPLCFSYGYSETEVVTLKGKIRRHTVWDSARANEHPLKHDYVKRTAWFLHLDEPICLNGDSEATGGFEVPEKNVRKLHIQSFDDSLDGGHWNNRRVALTGNLVHAMVIHDQTPVFIRGRSIIELR